MQRFLSLVSQLNFGELGDYVRLCEVFGDIVEDEEDVAVCDNEHIGGDEDVDIQVWFLASPFHPN